MKPLVCKKSHYLALWVASLLTLNPGLPSFAASHREAPITSLDTKADITDWYAFVSYNDPSKITMIMNVDPFLEPSNGPNYFPFDPEITYEMHIDNNFDAEEDISFQFKFKTETRLPQVFTGFVGVGNGVTAPANSPNVDKFPPGTPIIPPAITALDGPGSEGLGLRQTYTVKMLKGNGRNQRTFEYVDTHKLYAVPSNVGPRTMPDYPKLAKQGIYDLGFGVKVFAGTVDDPFYIDLGGAFDSLNFRAKAAGSGLPPGVFSDMQDLVDDKNFAADRVAGFNVNTIALEIPIALLTRDGKTHTAAEALAVLGTYATTSRARVRDLASDSAKNNSENKDVVQIQRMGNPLINELLIGTGDKDKFSSNEPKNDKQYADYLLDPLLARVINAAYAGVVPIPAAPRTDLLALVQYTAPICPGCTKEQNGPVADLLRLNTGIAPTPMSKRKRMGFIAGDAAGFPNGRRVSDDVTDIAARVVTGVLNEKFNAFPNNRIADGVNSNDQPYQESFPYVAFANSGRNSRHIDPGEAGCASVEPPFAASNCPVE